MAVGTSPAEATTRMMSTAAPSRFGRSVLDFLTRPLDSRGTAVIAVAAVALIGAACGGSLTPSQDAAHAADAAPNCANAGCAAPPLCSTGCQATCGCCSCTPGQRNGELVCTSQGCFAPAPADGGIDHSGWSPAAACALPFEVGVCNAAFQVYAYVGGACVPRVYGGCQGNDNRFSTLEECLVACEGRPVPNGCPAGRVVKEICLACGAGGGCGRSATVCALSCDADAGVTGCSTPLTSCYASACQAAFCI